jgi:integrase
MSDVDRIMRVHKGPLLTSTRVAPSVAPEVVLPRVKLTELGVARIKPPVTGRREVWDATLPGFGLRVTSTGARSWVVALRRPGSKHPVRIKVGEPCAMGLGEAREKARVLMRNPAALEERERAQADTVAAVVALFIERWQKPRNRSWQEVKRILSRELARWADRPIRTIARRDVIELIDSITDRGAPYMANRTLAHVRKLFGWAMQRGIVSASPVVGVGAPAREVSRDRVLDHAELAAVWRACEALGWPFCPIVRLLIVTGARRNEVASMRWRDLDLERAEWRLSREAVKNDREQVIPLSALALEIIRDLPQIDHSALVFPANRASSTNPVSGFSKVKHRLDQLSGVEGWRYHDIRRSVATGLQRLGVRLEVTEAVLGHVSGSRSGIVGVYQRHEYRDEKAAALAAWGREVERIVLGGTAGVVALRA